MDNLSFGGHAIFSWIMNMRSVTKKLPRKLSTASSSSSSSISAVLQYGPSCPNGGSETIEEVEVSNKKDEVNRTGSLQILEPREPRQESVNILAIASQLPQDRQPLREDVQSGVYEQRYFQLDELLREKLLQLGNLEYDLKTANAKFEQQTADMNEKADRLRTEVEDLRTEIELWSPE